MAKNRISNSISKLTSKVLNFAFAPQKFFAKHAVKEFHYSAFLTLINIISCTVVCTLELNLMMFLIFQNLIDLDTMIDFLFLWSGIILTFVTFSTFVLLMFYKVVSLKNYKE